MPIPDELQSRELSAPSAIFEHMRRRIGRVGLLVAVVSTVVASMVIFVICACASLR